MKDNFSKQSDLYSRFRPGYPRLLFDFLLPLVPDKKTAWDCGTGNGQVAVKLSLYFDEVYATDLSSAQIENADKKQNIFYYNAAERAPFIIFNSFVRQRNSFHHKFFFPCHTFFPVV